MLCAIFPTNERVKKKGPKPRYAKCLEPNRKQELVYTSSWLKGVLQKEEEKKMNKRERKNQDLVLV